MFFSLVVARMLTPMMAAYVLRVPRREHAEPGWLGLYMRWAQYALKHRIKVTLAVIGFTAASFFVGGSTGAAPGVVSE